MGKKIVFLNLVLIFTGHLNTQTLYRAHSSIDVYHGSRKLSSPFAGGMNGSVVSQMDLNLDGRKDLIISHNNSYKVSTFLHHADDSFVYAPKYEEYFPKEFNGVFQMKDLNEDGMEDYIVQSGIYILIFKGKRNLQDSTFSFSILDTFEFTKPSWPDYPETLTPFNNYLIAFEDLDNDGDIDAIYIDRNNRLSFFKNLKKEKAYTNPDRNEYWLVNRTYGQHFYKIPPLSFDEGYHPRIISGLKDPNLGVDRSLRARHDEYQMVWLLDVNNDKLMDACAYSENQRNNPLGLNIGSKDSAYYINRDVYFPSYSQPINKMMPIGFWLDANNDGKKDIMSSFMIERDDNSGVLLSQKAFNDDVNTISYYKNFGSKSSLGGLDSFAIVRDSFLSREMIDVGTQSAPVFYDYDLDGLLDLLISNRVKRDSWEVSNITYYKNIGTSQLPSYRIENRDLFGFKSKSRANIRLAVGDLNKDGYQDLLISSYARTVASSTSDFSTPIIYDIYYQKLNPQDQTAVYLADTIMMDYIGKYGQGNMCLYDITGDGLLDLFYGDVFSIKFYKNTGSINKPRYGDPENDTVIKPSDLAPFSYQYNFFPAIRKDPKDNKLYLYFSYVTDYGKIGRAVIDTSKLFHKKSLTILPNENNLFNISINRFPSMHFRDINADNVDEMILGNYAGGVQIFSFADIDKTGDSIRRRNPIVNISSLSPNVEIYPNPSESSVYVNIEGQKSAYNIVIMDLPGRAVKKIPKYRNQESIDISHLSVGIYQIVLYNDDFISSHRIEKK